MRRVDGAADPSFLAPPDQVADWRLVVLLDAVADAGVLDRLPGRGENLARELDLDPHGLRVLLNALIAWGVVTRDDDGHYARGPQAPDASVTATLRHHARALRKWAVAAGDGLRGSSSADDPPPIAQPEVFLDALAATARRSAASLVNACLARFPGARSVLDLGGCHGEYAMEFARRGLRATMHDRAAMVDIVRARGQLAAAGVDLYAGDFFSDVPTGPFDLLFCAGITHTFDGDHNQALYRRLRPIVTDGGGIAVATFLRGRHRMGDVFAVQMLLNGNGGDTHAEADYRSWLTAAGFEPDAAVLDLGDRGQSILFASRADSKRGEAATY